MNRDTWRNEMVRALVENNFVLFQVRQLPGVLAPSLVDNNFVLFQVAVCCSR